MIDRAGAHGYPKLAGETWKADCFHVMSEARYI